MTDNTIVVFHGFLNLTNLEKLKLVEAMNEYFDSIPDRERIRAANDAVFRGLKIGSKDKPCKCCGR